MNPSVALIILDGWGHRTETVGNAVALASTPTFERLWRSNPNAFLAASGEAVGLPANQVGNSEVGHMNIGAGRVVLQDLLRLTATLNATTPPRALKNFIAQLKKSGGVCHLLGLLSDGGVHSHINHITRLANLMAQANITTCLHLITDGRDTPPFRAPEYWQEFRRQVSSPLVTPATVSGRYFTLDRDRRFKRVAKSWQAMVLAKGKRAGSVEEAIHQSYGLAVSDEFITPTVLNGYKGMADGDGLLVANFRTDRVREILSSLVEGDFRPFPRAKTPRFGAMLGMKPYSIRLDKYMDSLLTTTPPPNCLGEVVAANRINQLRVAETEKYAHVTFFLNGGREEPFEGESRHLIPSPRVSGYDAVPQMSVEQVATYTANAITAKGNGLIIANFANPDMVGHTGSLSATIKAVEATDKALKVVSDAAAKTATTLVITADHGNAERMIAKNGKPHTAHTTSLVPIMAVGSGAKGMRDGKLADIAPTILELLGIKQPTQMKGASLLTSTSPNVIPLRG